MSKLLLTVLGFVIAGVKFPFIGRRPKAFTIKADTWPRVWAPGRLIHDLTNVAVELMRALFASDAEFWTKAVAALVLVLLVSHLI